MGPVRTYREAASAEWVERADSAAAHRMITAQILETPTLVAALVDILEITASDAR
jgi:hypothetical protein